MNDNYGTLKWYLFSLVWHLNNTKTQTRRYKQDYADFPEQNFPPLYPKNSVSFPILWKIRYIWEK